MYTSSPFFGRHDGRSFVKGDFLWSTEQLIYWPAQCSWQLCYLPSECTPTTRWSPSFLACLRALKCPKWTRSKLVAVTQVWNRIGQAELNSPSVHPYSDLSVLLAVGRIGFGWAVEIQSSRSFLHPPDVAQRSERLGVCSNKTTAVGGAL